ncbi:MAG: HRDC domain-containing protein, partial [Pseudomonadota bacterium]
PRFLSPARPTPTFAMRPEPRTRQRQAAAAAVSAGKDSVLFAALKALRREIASDRGVPAFVIFSDRTLADMAARKPRSAAAFGAVFGVGRAKTEAFSAQFIAAIERHIAGEDAAA